MLPDFPRNRPPPHPPPPPPRRPCGEGGYISTYNRKPRTGRCAPYSILGLPHSKVCPGRSAPQKLGAFGIPRFAPGTGGLAAWPFRGSMAGTGAQWGHSNDHNSAVRRATELIPGMPYTSRPSRSSWDRSRGRSSSVDRRK